MIQRHALSLVKDLAEQFPADLILGARQCGKTTLAKGFLEGEYFDLAYDPKRLPNLQVLDIHEHDRHLLLKVDDARFLCGHDERHWFVAAVPEKARASCVRDAKEALMPTAAREALRRNRVKAKKRHSRRNEGFIRQGEWFFLPEPDNMTIKILF